MYNNQDLFDKFVSLNNKQINVNNRLFNVKVTNDIVQLNSGKNSANYAKSNLHNRWTIKENKLHYFVMNNVSNKVERTICAEV